MFRKPGLVLAVVLAWASLPVAAGSSPAGAGSVPDPLGLDWCLERAQAANPFIAVDEAMRDAARERIAPAGALDDPRVRYEASNVPIGDFDFDSTPMSGHQLGLSQRLPFPGLLSNRRAAARAGAEAAELGVADRRLRVAAAVESAWAELGFAQRALGITERNLELLRGLIGVTEAKYRVGEGLQQDVLRGQVELTALLDERLDRHAAVERTSATLAALLDLPEHTHFPVTDALAADEAPQPLDELAAALEERSPRLRALQAEVEAARRGVRVAELEGYPDFDLGLGYRIRERSMGDPVDGDDFLAASVSVRLPIDRRKWNARVAERRALLRRAEAQYRAARAELVASLRTAHAELMRADQEVDLLDTGLVPQALQSLESSRSGYEVGRVDFPSVLDSQVRLLNAELRLVRARADRRRAFAALEAAAGEALR